MLKQGLYEQVVNTEIKDELRQLPEDSKHVEKIDTAESSSVLTQYLSEVVHKGLDRIAGDDISAQLNLVNKIVDLISQETAQDDLRDFTVDDEGEQLFALLSRDDPMMRIGQKKAKDLPRPETSIAQSSLFTGAVHEPQMFSELKKEIASADRIDMLVSFVKWSGLRLIIDDLQHFADRGGRLRVITTTYMGATDVKAVEALRKLPNTEIRVSYDTERTRLHAKAYMFYRETGFTTAYVGSSNLSNPAMSSGLEWNVKLTTKDMLPTIQKMEATFDSYWNTASFEVYEDGCRERLERALSTNGKANPTSEMQFVFDIQPYPYQQEILDRLQAEREVRGYYRNLVVAATGTGKTLISAFDYRRFCKAFSGSKPRLLFVVHREEILKQSRSAFRAVLKDPNFGELFVGSFKPSSLEHLFISVQTLASQKLYDFLPEDYYDFIIVDEFHHAAAPTYQGLLNHFKPKILLGLTATPERMDGKNVLDYFNGRIASEIRLPEAIERKLLCPFQYFGVSDDVDLSNIRWTRGGYDKAELNNVFSLNRAVAEKCAGGCQVAAGQAGRCVLYHAQQGGQGLLTDYHVQRLFDQRKPVPLAKSEHHLRHGKHRSALYQPPAARQQGRSLRAGVQAGQHWRCTVYLSWNGSLCEAYRQQTDEYYMASGPADSGEVSSQDEQAGRRIRKAFYENNSSGRRSHS